jgi:hypothetical protein
MSRGLADGASPWFAASQITSIGGARETETSSFSILSARVEHDAA